MEIVIPQIGLFFKISPKIFLSVKQKISESKNYENRIICVKCENPITTGPDLYTINNQSQFSFCNPVGTNFNISCYLHAPGCTHAGISIQEHTWFEGYAWDFANCNSCFLHLGWRFQAPEKNTFYGLITNCLK